MEHKKDPANIGIRFAAFLFATIGLLSAGLVYGVGLSEGSKAEIFQFFGRFHPLILHFPIVCVALLALFEFLSMVKGTEQFKMTTRILLYLLAASLFAAFASGYLLAWSSGSTEPLVHNHMQWAGYFVYIVVLAVLTDLNRRRLGAWAGTILFRTLVAAALVTSFYTSHQGGSITHGQNYLTKFAPEAIKKALGLQSPDRQKVFTTPEKMVVYTDLIHPIVQDNCMACHNSGKANGGLMMGRYEDLLAGGTSEAAVMPGDLEKSELWRRITLPSDHEQFMPAGGRPPLSPDEVKIIGWWIERGASASKTLAEEKPLPPYVSSQSEVIFKKHMPAAAIAKLAEQKQEVYRTIEALNNSLNIVLTPLEKGSRQFALRAINQKDAFGNESLEALLPFAKQIISLDLSETAIGPGACSILSQFTSLKFLNVRETRIATEELELLVSLDQLEVINVYATALSDENLAYFEKIPKLKRLYAGHTDVSKKGIAALRETLPNCQVVATFDWPVPPEKPVVEPAVDANEAPAEPNKEGR